MQTDGGRIRLIQEWGRAKAKHILTRDPATKEFGFFVVTAIHVAQSCEMKCWAKPTKSMSSKFLINSAVEAQLAEKDR